MGLSNYITAGVTAFAVALMAFGLHSCDVKRIEKKHAAAIVKQAADINAQCSTAKAITYGVSHEFQNGLSDLDTSLSLYRGMLDRCATDASGATDAGRGYHATPAGKKLSQGSGGNSRDRRIIELAGRAEKVRLQLKACQAFIKATDAPQGKKK